MALLRIAIEQLAPDRFVAEIELGRRDSLRATTLDDIVRNALARVVALTDDPGIGLSVTSAPMQQGAVSRVGSTRSGAVTPRAGGSR
jgi:hypothetical protein